MISPIAELRRFVAASLMTPVERDHRQSNRAFVRRRVVTSVSLAAGPAALGAALSIRPGDREFYLATLGVALVWVVGALASGPLHLGRAHTRTGATSRAVVQSLALGALLLGMFLLGALVVARVPQLRGPVDRLLDHARYGSLPLVALLTAVNGIGEELFFRGALYAAIGRRHAVALSSVIYAAVTAASGVPLLVFAAACLGVVTGLQRRVTGGILGPTITHLVWSLGMLFLLPVLLRIGAP